MSQSHCPFEDMYTGVGASPHACLTHVWDAVWWLGSISCFPYFRFSKALVNTGRRRRRRRMGNRVEDGGRYGDRAVGLYRRRERLVSKEMCVRDESVWDRLCLGAHLEGRVPLHHSLLCLSLPLPSPPQLPGHHLSWARPNCSPEIHLHLRTYCINLTPPFSKWTRVEFHRSIPLLLRA